MTRIVYAVAAHLHMTAGDVEARMEPGELFCWANLLLGWGDEPEPVDEGELLSVEDEIAAWR